MTSGRPGRAFAVLDRCHTPSGPSPCLSLDARDAPCAALSIRATPQVVEAHLTPSGSPERNAAGALLTDERAGPLGVSWTPGHSAGGGSSRKSVAVGRDEPIDAPGDPAHAGQQEQRSQGCPDPARAQEGPRDSPRPSFDRSGGRHPQHLVLGTLLSDAQGVEVGELPRDEVTTGPYPSFGEVRRRRAEAAVSVVDEHRSRTHGSIIPLRDDRHGPTKRRRSPGGRSRATLRVCQACTGEGRHATAGPHP